MEIYWDLNSFKKKKDFCIRIFNQVDQTKTADSKPLGEKGGVQSTKHTNVMILDCDVLEDTAQVCAFF